MKHVCATPSMGTEQNTSHQRATQRRHMKSFICLFVSLFQYCGPLRLLAGHMAIEDAEKLVAGLKNNYLIIQGFALGKLQQTVRSLRLSTKPLEI
eukprot:3278762-Amphidinium_carterae.1